MTAEFHRVRDQRRDVHAEAGDHPRRVRRKVVQQPPVRVEGVPLRWETEAEAVAEHEAVHRRGESRLRRGEPGAEASEAGLVARVRGADAVLRAQPETVPHVIVRVQVDEALRGVPGAPARGRVGYTIAPVSARIPRRIGS